jgi:hypothetical protein
VNRKASLATKLARERPHRAAPGLVSARQGREVPSNQTVKMKMKRLALAFAAATMLAGPALAEMTDLERSRNPLYGLTRNEFDGCHLIQYSLDGRALNSWSPFECYKFQWQTHRDAKACYGTMIRAYQNTYATNDVPAETQQDFQSGCAMLMNDTPAKSLPDTPLKSMIAQ